MFDNQLNKIATAIRRKRVALNYSQEYMAYKLGISQNGYSKTESGLTRMTVDRLFVIASLLNTDIGSLFTDEEENAQDHRLELIKN